MSLGKNPCFKWKARRVGSDDRKVLIFVDDADTRVQFLADDIAIDAPFLKGEMGLAPVDLFPHELRYDRQGYELGVSVLQGSAGGLSMILENQDIAEPFVFLQVQHAISEGPKDVLDLLLPDRGQRRVVIGRLDNDLVGSHPIHL